MARVCRVRVVLLVVHDFTGQGSLQPGLTALVFRGAEGALKGSADHCLPSLATPTFGGAVDEAAAQIQIQDGDHVGDRLHDGIQCRGLFGQLPPRGDFHRDVAENRGVAGDSPFLVAMRDDHVIDGHVPATRKDDGRFANPHAVALHRRKYLTRPALIGCVRKELESVPGEWGVDAQPNCTSSRRVHVQNLAACVRLGHVVRGVVENLCQIPQLAFDRDAMRNVRSERKHAPHPAVRV